MTFNSSGMMITQSGTDADLSSFATFIAGFAQAARATAYTSINIRRAQTLTAANTALIYNATTAGFSGTVEPAWPTTAGSTVVDNINATWTASTTLAVGAYRQPTAGPSATLAFRVSAITTGITSATQPTWPTVAGNSVVDGGVTWTAETALVWTARRAPTSVTFNLGTGIYRICTTGDMGLTISGTLTISPRRELFTVTPITGTGITFAANGVVNAGAVQTQINGLDWYERGVAIVAAPQANGANPIVVGASGAVMNIRGATIQLGNGATGSAFFLVQSGGRVNVREGTLQALDYAKDVRFRNELTGDIDAIGLRVVGVWINKNKPWINALDVVVENESGPELNTSAIPAADSFFEEIGFDASKTVSGFYTQKDFIAWQSPWVKIVDSPTGSNLIIQITSNSAGDAGVFEVEKRLDVRIENAAGTGLTDAFIFIEDTLNPASPTSVRPKSRSPAASGSGALNFGPQRSYSALSVAGVFAQQRILTAVCHTSANNWAYRGIGLANTDIFDVVIWHMASLYGGFPSVPMQGRGVLSLKSVPPVDITMSVTDRTVVAAYTSRETLDKLRDYLKYLKTTIGFVRIPTPSTEMCTSSGSTLTIPYNLVIDPAAASEVDVTGGTMTIRDTVLGEGSRHKQLVVTGTITLLGGASLACLSTSSGGSTGRLVLSGLVNASVRIADASNTELDFEANVTGTHTIYIARGVVGTQSYILTRYGYKTVVGTFPPSGETLVTPNWIEDPKVVDTASNVAAYASLDNEAEAYDYSRWVQLDTTQIQRDYVTKV